MLALVCIAPDGAARVEFENFDTVEEAYDHDRTMGTRLYFYPIHVVADADDGTILDTPDLFDFLHGEDYRTLQEHPETLAMLDEVCRAMYDWRT